MITMKRLFWLLPVLLLPGCIQVKKSSLRPPEPVSYQVNEDVQIISTGAVFMDIPFMVDEVDFMTAGFAIKAGTHVVYIDPFFVAKALKKKMPAAYILITHPHQDHFSMKDIRKLARADTVLIGPQAVAEELREQFPENRVVELHPGESHQNGRLRIQAVEAYNLKKGWFGLQAHPKESDYNGYVVSFDSVDIYHAGDTDSVPELNELTGLEVALVPIEGGDLTMTTKECIEFINRIKPAVVIPMHYNIVSQEVEVFRKAVRREVKVVVMDGIH